MIKKIIKGTLVITVLVTLILTLSACNSEIKYSEASDGEILTVWYNELNVRANPSTDASIVDVLRAYDTVKLTGNYKDYIEGACWLELVSGGWVSSEGLIDLNTTPEAPDKNPATAQGEFSYREDLNGAILEVSYTMLNVRSDPSTDATIEYTLGTGDFVKLTGKVESDWEITWYQLNDGNWVTSDGLKEN